MEYYGHVPGIHCLFVRSVYQFPFLRPLSKEGSTLRIGKRPTLSPLEELGKYGIEGKDVLLRSLYEWKIPRDMYS